MWRKVAIWIGAGAVLVVVSVVSYRAGSSRPSVLESEGVLRRALWMITFREPDSVVTVTTDSTLTNSQLLEPQDKCDLEFVDAIPYDMRSYVRAFHRPAMVWEVTCGVAGQFDAEVRRADRGWNVILRAARNQ